MSQIAEARQKERARTKQAERDWVDQIRVQRQQQLELQAVVEEVVSMGYDRDVVERIQLAQQHDSAIPLVRAVESESPKLRQAPLPKFVGISNPSSYCFLNATIQCLRHTPQLLGHLMEIFSQQSREDSFAAPARGTGSLIEAFVGLLKCMDRDFGSVVQDTDRARQDFLEQCLKLLPTQPGARRLKTARENQCCALTVSFFV